jgi:hypothetical protein
MFHERVSPPVVRVRIGDMYRYDQDEDGVGGSWSARGRSLPEHVVAADDNRMHDVLQTVIVETSLDWLDAVVAADALGDFDRLNQALEALQTHDFRTAFGLLWLICESRLHVVAARHGLHRSEELNVDKLCERLAAVHLLDADVKDRLDRLRRERNGVMHRNVEPSPESSRECLDLAILLLSAVVMDIDARVPEPWLLL